MVGAFNTVFNITLKVITEYWWAVAPVALFFIFRELWLDYVQSKYLNSLKWIVLEIKIPKEVQKTPKAMEQIFAGLHGIENPPNFVKKWFKGEVQDYFSFEIIGEGSTVHFMIRTLEGYRNLVEAQIYGQYPDAEITQIEDYTSALPSKIPSKDYNVWGAEIVLLKEDAYPIRTYPYFFQESKEEERIDPLAPLSEILSYLTPDEHIWVQILILPVRDEWKGEGEKLVEKLIGKKLPKSPRGAVVEEAHGWLEAGRESFHDLFFGSSKEKERTKKSEEKSLESSMLYLSPGQRDVVAAVEQNISKLGFKTLIRFVYWAKSDIFSKANIAAVLGAFKQFNTQNLNGFKPNKKTKTSIDYFLKKRREFYRKVKIINNYKHRYLPQRKFSKRGFIFNTEELATIYHIPGKIVEAPAMPRIEAKKGGAPRGLPTKE